MAVNNPATPGGGGVAFTGAAPGFLDFTGAVYGNHFDAKTGGTTWAADTGPDLVDTHGNASEVQGNGKRTYCYLRAGALTAALSASLQITGDLTLVMAIRRLDTATSNQTFVSMCKSGELAADNILYSVSNASTKLESRHESGAGVDQAFVWNTAESGDTRYFENPWVLVWLRRAGAFQYLGVDGFSSQGAFIASAPSGGGDGFLHVGSLAGGQLLASCGVAGLGIWDSDIGYSAVQEQVLRMKQGATKP